MIKHLFKKLLHKLRKKQTLKTKPIKNEYIKIVKEGDIVRFNNAALKEQIRNETLYGKCSNENCKCDRIFEENYVGLVIKSNEHYADIMWPENFINKISIKDIELVNPE